jgi:flagellar biosynthesis protein FlhF
MRVKTFRGKNMGAVLSQVKCEMGSEAVILSNQTVRENGEQVCEVMAALDSTTEIPSPRNSEAKPGNGDARNAPCGQANRGGAAPLGDWRNEWMEIKDHLLAFLKPKMELDRLEPRQRLAMEYLEKEGVDACVLLSVYRSIKEQNENAVLPALARLVAVRPLDAESWPQPLQIIAGPHGVGKTTTLLRVALAYKKENPKASVYVVNADGGQGKGRLILRHYAELSGLLYKDIHSKDDVDALAGAAGKDDRIFVDMPGLKAGRELRERLTELGLENREDAALHLALSPSYAPAQIRFFVEKHQSGLAGSIIWTKLDEAISFGSLINTAHYSGLPISALAFGPELKNNMVKATSCALWKLIFKRETPGANRDKTDGIG